MTSQRLLKLRNPRGARGKRRGAAVAPVIPVLPQQASMYLWLESDSGTPASGTIETWTDQSTEGNSPTQATPGSRPTMDLANTLNGIRTVGFGGSGIFLRLGSFTGGEVTGDSFALVVVKQDLNQGATFVGPIDGAKRRDVGRQTTHVGTIFPGTSDIDGSRNMPTEEWAVYAGNFRDNPATDRLFINSLSTEDASDASSGDDGSTGITVGGRWQATPLRPMNGQIAAIYAWRLTPSPTEMGEIEDYIAYKWGVRMSRAHDLTAFDQGFG